MVCNNNEAGSGVSCFRMPVVIWYSLVNLLQPPISCSGILDNYDLSEYKNNDMRKQMSTAMLNIFCRSLAERRAAVEESMISLRPKNSQQKSFLFEKFRQ